MNNRLSAVYRMLLIAAVTLLAGLVAFEVLLHVRVAATPQNGWFSFTRPNSGWLVVNPNIEADSIRGYRLVAGRNSRYVYFSDTCREIDFRMRVNNQGYASRFDYHHKKREGVKRYLVFGDSFSAGFITDTSWVDQLNFLCIRDKVPMEFYNFSIDGGGMANWWSIFRNEVAPTYEFDGVVLAPYMDNLNRFFVTWWYDTTSIKGAYLSSRSEYVNKEKWSMDTYRHYTEEGYMDYETSYLADASKQSRPFLLMPSFFSGDVVWGDPYERGQEKYYSRFIDKGTSLPFEKLAERYGDQNMSYLDSLAKMLSVSGRDFRLAIIPDKYIVRKKKKDSTFNALYEKDLDEVAKHYQADLFNGNDAFLHFGDDQLESRWLKSGDLHWNAKGARDFAEAYYLYLTKR